MACFTARCISDSSKCHLPSSPVWIFFHLFFCGKSHCHLNSLLPPWYLSERAWGSFTEPKPAFKSSLWFFVNFLYEILIRKWVFVNKRTVPALTCPYNYRHRMMTILFLLQAWHGYRFTFTQGRSAFLADAASLVSFSPKMSSCWKSVFSFAVTDYMYVAASCLHSGRFFWNLFLNCDSGFAFLFWTGTLFFSHKKDCFF